jgi:hypothetical protein
MRSLTPCAAGPATRLALVALAWLAAGGGTVGPAVAQDPPEAGRARLWLPQVRSGAWYDGTLTFAVIGDYGVCATGPEACATQTRVADLVKGWSPRFVVTTGDNNYPRGRSDTWEENTRPYATFIPDRFEPAVGNHDYLCSQCPEAGFVALFRRPLVRELARPDELAPLVRLFFLDSNAADPDADTGVRQKAAARQPLAAQRAWLESGLRRLDACWKLVVLHHPPYSSTVEPGSNAALQSAAGWTYRQWGADLVLSGHAHVYERIVRPGGFAYVVNGAGGGVLDPFAAVPVAGSVRRINDAHGALRVQADARRLELEFWTVAAAGSDAPPTLRDSHVIERDCNAPAAVPAAAPRATAQPGARSQSRSPSPPAGPRRRAKAATRSAMSASSRQKLEIWER